MCIVARVGCGEKRRVFVSEFLFNESRVKMKG